MNNNFPKASKYDPEWMKENMMGPNSVFLLERLTDRMNLKPGMRVLDLGCGMGITSVFLAKEYGVQVWATDLWISATENHKRFIEAGVSDLVYPIHAEAHELPYADGFFNAIVSIDAYHYFGTEKKYLDAHCSKLLKPYGQVGIVVPGLSGELEKDEIPPGLEKYWEDDFNTFHSSEWWKKLWDDSSMIEVEYHENMSDGKKIWYESIWRHGEHGSDFDREFLKADRTDAITLVMMIGKKI